MKQIPVDECPASYLLYQARMKLQYSELKPLIDLEIELIVANRGDPKDTSYEYLLKGMEWMEENIPVFEALRCHSNLAITRAYLKARGIEFVEIPEELCDD